MKFLQPHPRYLRAKFWDWVRDTQKIAKNGAGAQESQQLGPDGDSIFGPSTYVHICKKYISIYLSVDHCIYIYNPVCVCAALSCGKKQKAGSHFSWNHETNSFSWKLPLKQKGIPLRNRLIFPYGWIPATQCLALFRGYESRSCFQNTSEASIWHWLWWLFNRSCLSSWGFFWVRSFSKAPMLNLATVPFKTFLI